MKRIFSGLLVLTILLSVAVCGVFAEDLAGSHTVVVKALGEGNVLPEGSRVVLDGGTLTLRFFPDEGFEVVAIYVDGYPVTHVLPHILHCRDCDGCEECDWIDLEKLYTGIEDDDWSDWKTSITLREVCKDHMIYVQFVEKEAAEESPSTELPEVIQQPVFTDLQNAAWYAEAVGYMTANGYMDGVGGGLFAPEENLTRAQLVTMLWRLEGQPAVKHDLKVTDVAEGLWYTEAVRWAEAEQIVTGSNGRFAPQDPITREQLAAILWRYAKYKEMDVSVGENTNILSYNDAFTVSEYAYPALQWTCGAGILNGADGNLMPQGHATRAQAAAMLYRFLTLE